MGSGLEPFGGLGLRVVGTRAASEGSIRFFRRLAVAPGPGTVTLNRSLLRRAATLAKLVRATELAGVAAPGSPLRQRGIRQRQDEQRDQSETISATERQHE